MSEVTTVENWLTGGAVGIWSNLPDIHLAEMAGRSGADWICFDLQHGLMDFQHLLHLMPAVTGTELNVLVRVAANQADQIGKALDVGADGVIVPMVNNAAEAAAAVSAALYPPAGNRSCGPMRPAMLEGFGYLQSANERLACIPMIETREGLANLDAILAVDGVAGVFVGPMDLCYGLDLTPGDFANPVFQDAISTILKACDNAGKPAGMFGYDAPLAKMALEQGFSFVSVGTDIGFYRAGLTQAMDVVRQRDTGDGKPSVGY